MLKLTFVSMAIATFVVAGCNGQNQAGLSKDNGIKSPPSSNDSMPTRNTPTGEDPSLSSTQDLKPGDADQISEYVVEIYEDRKGNLWIGTHGGVCQYDGSSFSEFHVPIVKEEISSYAIMRGNASLDLEDKNGTLWFGFSGGLFRFNGSSIVNVTKGGPWT